MPKKDEKLNCCSCLSLLKRKRRLSRCKVGDSNGLTNETSTDSNSKRENSPEVKTVKDLLVEYCENTSIHGLQYLGQRERTFCERVFWTFSLLISLMFCTFLIWNVYVKWDTSPVIVSFNEKPTPIWQIPFPAITICPETKVSHSTFNWTDDLRVNWFNDKLKGETEKKLNALSQICDPRTLPRYLFEKNQSVNPNLLNILKDIAPTMNNTIIECDYTEINDCEHFFHEVITEEGKCYTFNALDGTEIYREETLHDGFPRFKVNKTSKWTMEEGYEKGAGLEVYPHRALAAGSQAGLHFRLRFVVHPFDYFCRRSYEGFKVLLHSPEELPQISKHFFRVPADQEVIVSVRPQMIQTSAKLNKYSPQHRQCFFNNERHLRYFKLYTQANCELECLTNHTLRRCGCVKFFMPRNKDTPVCGLDNYNCVGYVEWSLLTNEINENLASSTKNRREMTECNCLPSCTSISYDADTSQSNFKVEILGRFQSSSQPWMKKDDSPKFKFSELSVFFKENRFIASKRSELYGPIDFIANCGGLLGLFMGISLLSIVEMIYFCTVRLWENLMWEKEKKKEETGVNKAGKPVVGEKLMKV